MHHGRTQILRLHERFLITCKERHSSFLCFFDRHISVSDQNRNLQILAAEIFKDSEGIAREVFPNILIPVFSFVK